MSECVFCKIIAGDLPADSVYEDDNVLAFMSIGPMSAGHVLVIPKEHAQDFSTMSDDAITQVFTQAKRVAASMMEGLGADGYNLSMNTGAAAGQEVFHAHLHIIPRYAGDGLEHWQPIKNTSEQRASAAHKIREAF